MDKKPKKSSIDKYFKPKEDEPLDDLDKIFEFENTYNVKPKEF
jgi:hypothetical protein